MILLQRLAGIPTDRRTAPNYRCVLVAARDGQPLHTAEGSVEGSILEAPRGTGGFGYDLALSTCPASTAPWPKLISKPSSPSAIAAEPSPPSCLFSRR